MAENVPNYVEVHPNLPNFLLSVRLKYVKLGYHYLISNAIYLLIVPILVALLLHLSTFTLEDLMNHLAMLKSCSTLIVFLATVYFMSRPRNIYLVDFSCYKRHERFMMSKQRMIEKMSDMFDEESLMFQKRILERSGLGDKTYILNNSDKSSMPFNFALSSNQYETTSVIIGAIDDLLTKTGVKIGDIGIVIVNSSAFNPTSSLSSMIVNHYKLGVHVNTYNLGGMGCSAGSLSKDLMAVAGEALKTNITTLGPLVLPMSEQLLFFASLTARNVFKRKTKPYIPDFKMAFEHFCIHAGGRAVLDEFQKNLDLPEYLMEPSRMTLYRFGNTSSSSIWYNLAYSEAKGRIKKGDRVWQIGFGSGFKCNSAVWRALRTVDAAKEKNAWTDEIQDFPVRLPC